MFVALVPTLAAALITTATLVRPPAEQPARIPKEVAIHEARSAPPPLRTLSLRGNPVAFGQGCLEAATPSGPSRPFVLDHDGVRLLMAGWNTAPGSGRSWNHVILRAADGTEIDRRGAPNSLTFVPVYLDGSGYEGKAVYLEAVDDADQNGWSMFCIDDVRTASLPGPRSRALDPLPAFDPVRSIALEDEGTRVEVSRHNGAITRIFDRKGKLDLIREPRLAGNFKFSLPLPGKEPWETIEANYFLGDSQRLSSFDLDRAAHRLTLRWHGPLVSRTGETYDLAARMGIELTGAKRRKRYQRPQPNPSTP